MRAFAWLVPTLASLGLWAVGRHTAAILLLAFSGVVDALAQLRPVRVVADGVTGWTTCS